jgi:hypothetical protein
VASLAASGGYQCVSWNFWRLVFCSIWLENIKDSARQKARPLAVMVNGTWPQGNLWTQAGQHHRDAGPLSLAAKVFRQRISEELTMFSVVSVLLASMTFAPIVTPFDANIQNGPVLDCFVVSCYLGLVLSVLLTGMYTRLATALRYCPGSKYIIWYIYRFEPTFALMHITFMFTIHLVIIAGSCALWSQWRCQFMQGEGGWDFMLHPLAFSQLGSSGNPNIFNGTSALNTTGTTFGECVSEGNRALTGLFIALACVCCTFSTHGATACSAGIMACVGCLIERPQTVST